MARKATKYVPWLIFYYGSFIPLIIALIQIIGGLNDKKVTVILACFGIYLVMEVIAIIIASEQRRGWKESRNAHADLLKTKNK